MTIEEIRKNAPDGATHYHEYKQPIFINVEYARFVGGIRQIWNHYFNDWIFDCVDELEQSSEEFKPL
jgi:hypothetical protein